MTNNTEALIQLREQYGKACFRLAASVTPENIDELIRTEKALDAALATPPQASAPADVESFVLPASQVDALAELHFSTLNYLHCHQWREFARDVARASLRSWEESKGQK